LKLTATAGEKGYMASAFGEVPLLIAVKPAA